VRQITFGFTLGWVVFLTFAEDYLHLTDITFVMPQASTNALLLHHTMFVISLEIY